MPGDAPRDRTSFFLKKGQPTSRWEILPNLISTWNATKELGSKKVNNREIVVCQFYIKRKKYKKIPRLECSCLDARQ